MTVRLTEILSPHVQPPRQLPSFHSGLLIVLSVLLNDYEGFSRRRRKRHHTGIYQTRLTIRPLVIRRFCLWVGGQLNLLGHTVVV